ncbi:MAG: cyclophilin-like fold protein [Clostridium sp.]|nr:cyclophilin-like fold protein [Clostridium sp.]
MRKCIAVLLSLLLPFTIAACGSVPEGGETGGAAQNMETARTDSGGESATEPEINDMVEIEENAIETEENMAETEESAIEINENMVKTKENAAETEENSIEMNQIYIKVGENTLTAVLEENESAKALKELLAEGPLTIAASNYGGFEKVCALGTELPRNDSQTTTHGGDICLYSGNQIVIFYGSNSWAYTRLGKIIDADEAELEKILSGEETEITLSLTNA